MVRPRRWGDRLCPDGYRLWATLQLRRLQFPTRRTVPLGPQLGLNWSLAVDGLSAPLILLTGLVNVLAIAAAWNVSRKPRLFYSLILVLLSAQIGVFAAQDLLLFFLMWEVELVPVYLLISIWGGLSASTPPLNLFSIPHSHLSLFSSPA